MGDVFWYLGVVTTLFVLLLILTTVEARRGHRVVLSGFRSRCDRVFDYIGDRVSRSLNHVVRHIIQLSWYYSVHAFLKVLLKMLAALYHWIEATLYRNRTKARRIRKERSLTRSYFDEVAEHKQATKLSPEEQQKLKDRQLESG